MNLRDEDIRQILTLGEDSRWEFKQIEFAGNRPKSPTPGELGDEVVAFANAGGGLLLCGVTDDGRIPGMTPAQMAALDDMLVKLCRDGIEPPVMIELHHRTLDGKGFVAVHVPRGDSLHERKGVSYIRVGAAKRKMTADERQRLAERRSQARYLWFDKQTVPDTGLGTLEENLWKPLLSAEGARQPQAALEKLALLARDEAGVERATVAGILLCAGRPEEWLPNATITATRYRGTDRTTRQLDAQEIVGPLNRQIAEAVAFAVRNMHVAARKTPARIDMPQYSEKAIFEAVVNAVVHRDYSMRGSRVRLSMFADRLEIQSPGSLPNNLTLDSMELRQATRNEAIASIMGRLPPGGIPGSGDRSYFMERRGDGVAAIQRETRELSGKPARFQLVDDAELILVIPAAPLDATACREVIQVRAQGRPLPGADVLALFPNKTWKQAVSDERGEAVVELYTRVLPMTVFASGPGHAAGVQREWIPASGPLRVELKPLPHGGSAIFEDGAGRLPGLKGSLNPIRDALDRTYLYGSDVSVNEGQPQPVHFGLGEDLRVTDADGVSYIVRVIEVFGRSTLIEFRLPDPD